ncbi:unnamed protein product [Paramecium sonneborni]|uniref:Guanylate-binding protein N-terminal domain-containing protein n=1 Tax=Paramecium sonneborni TaxID=65129 RepID=A0A8S1RBN1_9CILI|nr:unnamed protein product [Paramecium sonneborni]
MFNSIGCIEEQSIIQLHLTTLLSKNIQVQDHDNSNNENILCYYTSKVWLFRDFVLEMKNGQNRKIKSKEYLEFALYNDRQYQCQNSKNIRKTLLTCVFRFLTAYDQKFAGTEKANTFSRELSSHHSKEINQFYYTIIISQFIRQKYSQNKNQEKEEKSVQ